MDLTHIWHQLYQAAAGLSWLEIASVICGLAYVLLAAREIIWCWLFGLLGSAFSILLFYRVGLYAESGLYVYYVLAAVYGWWQWRAPGKQNGPSLPVVRWPLSAHLPAVLWVGLAGLALGWLLDAFTPARYPWIDSQTTVFSFWATYLVARKVLGNWIFWILIDSVSVGLYWNRQLYLYALLMLIYTVLAVWGWYIWQREWRKDHSYLESV